MPQKAKTEKPKEEARVPAPTPEPEIVAIPPEEVLQSQPQQKQSHEKES
jgi:hypothetical protein